MSSDARKLAVEALILADRGGYSNIVADSVLSSNQLSREDEALFSLCFYGCIERMLTIDSLIDRYSSVKTVKMKPLVRFSISVAVYQILFTDKIPVSAAVNESVNIVKNSPLKNLSGFVNAVCRRFAKEKEHILSELATTEDYSFKYSCNKSLFENICNDYGLESTIKFFECSFKKPPLYIRKNTLTDGFSDDVSYEPTELKNCYILKNTSSFTKSDDFLGGRYHVEDKSCQTAVEILNPLPNERVLDTCAAPGGKSFTIAEMMNGTGQVVSCDIHKNRVHLIEDGAMRLHIPNISAVVNDATVYNTELGEFDKILCDVPCSGYGVIRRKPEIRMKDVSQFEKLPEVQYKILSTSAKYLKLGGKLLYSTCTVRKAENIEVVNKFLSEHKDYKLVTSRTFMPFEDDTDGFFYALLTR